MFLEKTYEKIPQYREGAKTLGISYKVRPVFVDALGAIIILLSTLAVVARCSGK